MTHQKVHNETMVQGWCNMGFHKYLLHRKQNMTDMLWLLHKRCLVMARHGNQRNGRNHTTGEILRVANIRVKDTYGMGFATPSWKSERIHLLSYCTKEAREKSFLHGRMQCMCFTSCTKKCFEVDLNHWHKDFQSFALTNWATKTTSLLSLHWLSSLSSFLSLYLVLGLKTEDACIYLKSAAEEADFFCFLLESSNALPSLENEK